MPIFVIQLIANNNKLEFILKLQMFRKLPIKVISTKMDNRKIRIVKKTDAQPARRDKSKVVKPRNAAREMVATVSEWVTDLKERKGVETKAAFDALFTSTPQTSES